MRLCSITPVAGGGFLLRIYEIDHAADSLNPKIAGSALKRLFRNSSVTIIKFSGGILPPRDFQLLTAGRLRPSRSAAAVVPPSASITSSTDLSMPQHSLQGVNLSRVQMLTIDGNEKTSKNRGVDDDEVIGERLRLWVLAEGLRPKHVYEQIGCTKGAWSQYTNGKRHLTLDIADKLHKEFGLTLDWIYYGNFQAGMPANLSVRMREISDNERRGVFIGRTRPSGKRGGAVAPKPKATRQ